MEKEKLDQLMLDVIAGIPTGTKVSQKALIGSFETTRSMMHKKEVDLNALAKEAQKSQHPDYEKANEYFKAVHAAIRVKAEKKTTMLVKALEATLGFTFDKGIAQRVFEAMMLSLDPNINTEVENNWNGLADLVVTRGGLPVAVIMNDENLEMFKEVAGMLELELEVKEEPKQRVKKGRKSKKEKKTSRGFFHNHTN